MLGLNKNNNNVAENTSLSSFSSPSSSRNVLNNIICHYAHPPPSDAAPTDDTFVSSLATVLTHLVFLSSPTRGEITRFHAIKAPDINIKDYLDRIAKYFGCSNECFVLSLVYIDRIVKLHDEFTVNVLNIHRLLITSVMLAAKFFDDVYYSNAFYARVGGVKTREINILEAHFLILINYQLFVSPPEYDQYRRNVMAAVSAASIQPSYILLDGASNFNSCGASNGQSSSNSNSSDGSNTNNHHSHVCGGGKYCSNSSGNNRLGFPAAAMHVAICNGEVVRSNNHIAPGSNVEHHLICFNAADEDAARFCCSCSKKGQEEQHAYNNENYNVCNLNRVLCTNRYCNNNYSSSKPRCSFPVVGGAMNSSNNGNVACSGSLCKNVHFGSTSSSTDSSSLCFCISSSSSGNKSYSMSRNSSNNNNHHHNHYSSSNNNNNNHHHNHHSSSNNNNNNNHHSHHSSSNSNNNNHHHNHHSSSNNNNNTNPHNHHSNDNSNSNNSYNSNKCVGAGRAVSASRIPSLFISSSFKCSSLFRSSSPCRQSSSNDAFQFQQHFGVAAQSSPCLPQSSSSLSYRTQYTPTTSNSSNEYTAENVNNSNNSVSRSSAANKHHQNSQHIMSRIFNNIHSTPAAQVPLNLILQQGYRSFSSNSFCSISTASSSSCSSSACNIMSNNNKSGDITAHSSPFSYINNNANNLSCYMQQLYHHQHSSIQASSLASSSALFMNLSVNTNSHISNDPNVNTIKKSSILSCEFEELNAKSSNASASSSLCLRNNGAVSVLHQQQQLPSSPPRNISDNCNAFKTVCNHNECCLCNNNVDDDENMLLSTYSSFAPNNITCSKAINNSANRLVSPKHLLYKRAFCSKSSCSSNAVGAANNNSNNNNVIFSSLLSSSHALSQQQQQQQHHHHHSLFSYTNFLNENIQFLCHSDASLMQNSNKSSCATYLSSPLNCIQRQANVMCIPSTLLSPSLHNSELTDDCLTRTSSSNNNPAFFSSFGGAFNNNIPPQQQSAYKSASANTPQPQSSSSVSWVWNSLDAMQYTAW